MAKSNTVLPNNLTAVPNYPGYFWDVANHVLYSIKVAGELRIMRPKKFYGRKNAYINPFFRHYHYTISHHGRRQYLSHASLCELKNTDKTIPFAETACS